MITPVMTNIVHDGQFRASVINAVMIRRIIRTMNGVLPPFISPSYSEAFVFQRPYYNTCM